MRAVIETVFDIFYLVTVLTVGVRMICGSKAGTQFRLFGLMAVVLGAGDSFHLVPRAGTVHHWSGKLRRAAGSGQVDHLCDHDRVLCAAVLRLAQALPDRGAEERDRRCVRPVRCAHCAVHDAAEPVAHQPPRWHGASCAMCPLPCWVC